MSERISVPLEGSNVVKENATAPEPGHYADGVYTPPEGGRFVGGVYRPPERKVSLHELGAQARQSATRRQGETEWATEWQEDRRGNGGFVQTRRPVQRQPEAPAPPDPLTQQVGQLTSAVTMLAQRQLGIEPDQGPQRPDPSQFDLWSPEGVAEFNQATDQWVEAQKQEALAPHRAAIESAEVARFYNDVANKYRDHPNFREIEAAVQYQLANYDGKSSIKEMFANAVDPEKARPGWAGNICTPKQIAGKLGALATHRGLLKKAWRM